MDCREARKWMAQALHTYDAIEADLSMENYGWACFKSHQAAEFALKSLIRSGGGVGFGHDLGELLEEARGLCPSPTFERELEDCIRTLNRYYIPPRYPDAWPGGGAPFKEYDRKEAVRARECAWKVLEWVRKCLKHCLE